MKKKRIKGYYKNKLKYKKLVFVMFDFTKMFDDTELFENN